MWNNTPKPAWKITRCLAATLGMLAVGVCVQADPPKVRPIPSLDLPDLERDNEPTRRDPDADREQQSAIHDALRGGDARTSDPMLDGVLDAIRRRGSVLDGSMLDTLAPKPMPRQSATPTRASRANAREANARHANARHANARQANARRANARRARLAEDMLKVARRLEKQSGADEELDFLVDRLRHHAARILLVRE